MKTCQKCRVDKNPHLFPRDKSRNDGLHPYCKECHKKRWVKVKDLPRTKKVAKRNGRKHRLKEYGITPEEYSKILLQQNGVCAICNEVNRNGDNLSVDHCHTSNEIRGLLCNRCNWALGKFNDSPVLLRKAINYVTQNCVCK